MLPEPGPPPTFPRRWPGPLFRPPALSRTGGLRRHPPVSRPREQRASRQREGLRFVAGVWGTWILLTSPTSALRRLHAANGVREGCGQRRCEPARMHQLLWRLLGPSFGSSASGQQPRGRGGGEEAAGRGAQLLRAPVPSPSLAASSTGAAPPCSSGAPCRPGQQPPPSPHPYSSSRDVVALCPLCRPRATACHRSPGLLHTDKLRGLRSIHP